jgi:DNA-binding beta-propeller fold protein YncE
MPVTMNRHFYVCLALLFALAIGVKAQEVLQGDESAPLVLVRIIPIPDVLGRFDHMGVDNQTNRVFAPVYGNDTVEVLDVARGRRIRSLQGDFIKPQMVLYIPGINHIMVSNEGDGSCKIFDAETYNLIDTVKFPDDSDQLGYNPATKRVYVAYGDGTVGMFDATTNKRIEGDFR